MGMSSPTIANNPTTQSSGKGMAQSPIDQNAVNANPQGFAQWQQGAAQQEQQYPGSTMNGQQSQMFGKGNTTNSATSGQPQMGVPMQNPQANQMYQPQRNFPNTIQSVDNTGNMANNPLMQVNGKSGGSAQGVR